MEQFKKILTNWFETNQYLGVKRKRLMSFSDLKKSYLINRILASMRKNKIIILNKGNYFYNQNGRNKL